MHTSTIRTALVVALCGVLGTSAFAAPAVKDKDKERDAKKDAQPRARLPVLGPDAVVPACYNANTGTWRVVAPWGHSASTSPSTCRPPAPWDSLNVPASG